MPNCCPNCRACCTPHCAREPDHHPLFVELLAEQQRTNRLLQGLLYFLAGGVAGTLLALALLWGRRL